MECRFFASGAGGRERGGFHPLSDPAAAPTRRGCRLRGGRAAAARRAGIFSLPSRDWSPLRVYSLSSRVIGLPCPTRSSKCPRATSPSPSTTGAGRRSSRSLAKTTPSWRRVLHNRHTARPERPVRA
eukprot:1184538-Prorocentrum_minimum.AAC.1